MQSKQFRDVNSAYREILKDLNLYGSHVSSTSDPASVGSHFGKNKRWVKEIINYSFSIESPRNRAVFSPVRKINLPFAVANCIWTLCGSNDLNFIQFYNEKGIQFSDDKQTLSGSHGKRLFDAEGVNQIQAIVNRLKEDPFSRRTVATIYSPADNIRVSKDIPCPIALQFLQRENKLHTIAYMRSQSAALVLPYDVFAFTFIQEAMAVELGLELGTYHHVAGSLHYYVDEEPLIQQIIASDEVSQYTDEQIPEMPKPVSPLSIAKTIMELENIARNKLSETAGEYALSFPEMPKYWSDLFLILLTKVMQIYGKDIRDNIIGLPDYYARLLIPSNIDRKTTIE